MHMKTFSADQISSKFV